MKADLRAMQVIHIALSLGVTLFMGVTLVMIGFELEPNFTNDMQLYLLMVFLVALIGAILSRIIPTRLMSMITNKKEASNKFAAYRTASIIQWALLEGPALISIIFLLLHRHLIFLLVALFLLVILISNRPTPEKASRATGINLAEFL